MLVGSELNILMTRLQGVGLPLVELLVSVIRAGATGGTGWEVPLV